VFRVILGFESGSAWTYVHIIHSFITFYYFHWVLGSPFTEDQGQYYKLTFWEQIDLEKQGTPQRKFWTSSAIILFLLASHYTNWRDPWPLYANVIACLVSVISKLPSMHRIRLFGVNNRVWHPKASIVTRT